MATFIVIGAFDPEVDLPLMSTVIPEEVAQVEILKGEGRLASVHISPARGRVFLEIIAEDAAEAQATTETLPMAKWWSIDVYPTVGPPPATTTNSKPGSNPFGSANRPPVIALD